jgi:hypothetical protein
VAAGERLARRRRTEVVRAVGQSDRDLEQRRRLKEEVTFDRSAVTSLDWASYPILTFPEIAAPEGLPGSRPTRPRRSAKANANIDPSPLIAAPDLRVMNAHAMHAILFAKAAVTDLTGRRCRTALAN